MKFNIKKTFSFLIIFILIFTSSLGVLAEGQNSNTGEGYEEVVVPAIWYPINPVTNQVIEGLNPIPTHPSMFPRSEVAEIIEGVPNITYMGTPAPESPGSWSANNFMYTSNLFFTDRFHRIVMQGYRTYDVGTTSAVRRLEYGEFIDEDLIDGLPGIKNTLYQNGETLKLYIAARDANLTDGEFYKDEIEVLMYTDKQVRDEILSNILEIKFQDLKFHTPLSDLGKMVALGSSDINTMFLYKYDDNDSEDGAFLENSGSYRNFMDESMVSLTPGKYEIVLPIYWKEVIHEWLSGPNVFSRNRYTFDDTVHFTAILKEPTPLMTKDVEGKEEHTLANKNEEFTYNIKVRLPGETKVEPASITELQSRSQNTPFYEEVEEVEDEKEILVIEDTLEDVLEILGTNVLVDGVEDDELKGLVDVEEDKNRVSLSISDNYIDGLIDKEIVLQIKARIRGNAVLSQYKVSGNKIPNFANLYFDGYCEKTDKVNIIFTERTPYPGNGNGEEDIVIEDDDEVDDDTVIEVDDDLDIPDDTVVEVEDEVDIETLPKTGTKSKFMLSSIGVVLLLIGFLLLIKRESIN